MCFDGKIGLVYNSMSCEDKKKLFDSAMQVKQVVENVWQNAASSLMPLACGVGAATCGLLRHLAGTVMGVSSILLFPQGPNGGGRGGGADLGLPKLMGQPNRCLSWP